MCKQYPLSPYRCNISVQPEADKIEITSICLTGKSDIMNISVPCSRISVKKKKLSSLFGNRIGK